MLTLKAKLMFGFSLILVFMIGQSAVTYFYVSKSEALVAQAINKDFNASIAISRIAIEGNKLRRYEKEFFVYADNFEKRAKYHKEWRESYNKLTTELNDAVSNKTGVWSELDKQEVQTWIGAHRAYGAGFEEVVAQVEAGEIQGTLAANAAIQDAKNKFKVLLNGAAKGGAAKLAGAEGTAVEIKHNSNLVNLIVIFAATAGTVLALVLLLVIPTSVARPIEALAKAAQIMSMGNLDTPVPQTGGAEFRQLRDTLERMRISQKTFMAKFKSQSS